MRVEAVLQGEEVRRVVVLRALQLGDLMCAIPALRSLRSAFPGACISLIGLPGAAEFARRFSRYIDEFVSFPGYPGLPEREPELGRIPAFLSEMQARRFDLAIQMHGSGFCVNSLVALFGATACAGFFVRGEYCPDERLFMEYPNAGNEILRLVALTEFLGLPVTGASLEFPLTRADERAFSLFASTLGLRGKQYVCIHAGSRAEERRWPVHNFARVADLIARAGFAVVLTGSANEGFLTAECAALMTENSINTAGKTGLSLLGCLLRNSRLLVANDTGISHIAAALRVPSLVLFSGSDPARWAPLDRSLHVPVVTAGRSADEIGNKALQILQEGVPRAA